MEINRFARLLLILGMLGTGRLWAQPCAVTLGPDTALCAATYALVPGLSVTTFEDSLEIVYDATQGQTGLVGATKVYLHSGAELVPFGGWQYPVGNWGQDDGLGQMTSIGTDLWRIRLVPHSYYNFAATAQPNGIFMVFRNANGSATGKDGSGNDIWVDLGADPPVSAFGGVQPRWIRDGLDSLLWSDGSTGGSLTVTGPGTYWVQMTDTSGCTASDTVHIDLGAIPLVDLGQPAICDGIATVLDAGAGFASYAWSTGASTQTITLASPATVVVTVTNAAGCTGIDVVTVPAASSPVAAFTPTFMGFDILFVDGSTGGGTYQWDFESDGTIDATTPGTTSHSYPNSAMYTATLIVTNACGSDTSVQTFYAGEIGYAEEWIGGLSLYPNPAQSHITLDLALNKAVALEWRLLDAQGRMVVQVNEGRRAGNVRKEFELQALPSGMYRLALVIDGKVVGRSFVKL